MLECLHSECNREFESKDGRNTHIGMKHDMESLSISLLEEYGENPGYENVFDKIGISVSVYENYFGSWGNALEQVGLNKKNNSGKENPAWSGGKSTVVCKFCNKEYKVTPAITDRTSFCSKDCQSSWMSEKLVGERHYSWKEDVINKSNHYNRDYVKVRKRVKNRDSGCVICGEAKTDAHHIKPVKEFDNPNDAHTEENMVSLCRKHHKKYEGKYTNLSVNEFKSKVLSE